MKGKERKLKKEKIIKCPKCNVNMDKMSNGKYLIDKCPNCKGIFLDGEEVQHIRKMSFFSYLADYFRRNKHE
jgi:Zn-finger nucleic acid-binding protein